ncbi:MAG: A/G-specific adenine glycosylase [Terriglobales bacterium]
MPTNTSLAAIVEARAVFRGRLLRWYVRNRRELPWRGTRDPYAIWISEIMLQQTRVNAVVGHYRRFRERFPSLRELAAASEADVLAAWSGLGYYRRARMMRLAAQQIVAEHAGVFPQTAAALRELPGIGRYTAAAIASIAYDEPQAVVDGNVERVVGRIAGRALPQNAIWDFGQEVISQLHPGDFNQAMMELGAMVCTPKAPACGECPVRSFCRSRGRALVAKPKAARKVAAMHYIFARRRDCMLLVQRNATTSLMPGMWELPQQEASSGDLPLLRLRHAITTTDFQVSIFAARGGKGRWVPLSEVSALPLTGLARKVLTRLGAIASSA